MERPLPVCLVQPPLVQLNSPYPAPYYLKSFLEGAALGEGAACRVLVRDHSIGLFEKIFCRAGLEKVFAAAKKPGSSGDRRRAGYVERFFSEQSGWIASVDRLVNFLRGRDQEWGHLLALANGALPSGPRADAFLDAAEGQISPEEAPLLGSKLLADLADFITLTLDPSFSLVRYVPSLAEGPGFRDFRELERSLDGPVMELFYRPFLEEEWAVLEKTGTGPSVLGLTIPFPGCLAGALVCARSARARFGPDLIIIAGGGYVNTELRFLDTPAFFDYVDYLSFDRGYGSLRAILEHRFPGFGTAGGPGGKILYRTMYRGKDGGIIRDPEIAGEAAPDLAAPFAPCRQTDQEAVKTVFPDYRGLDFSRYLCPVDDANPMHRLWSQGRWLKAYLAHGCYWRRCIFCDTSLDYIRSFEPVDLDALFRHLLAQAEASGVRGVHLVDEAAPPGALLRLAELNRAAGLPLVFWGNIRFDRAFDPDTAAVLAAGGLLGVSAGIEVATEAGFKRLGKGIGLEEVVRVCAAFKEAGILTHGYLIYGYWDSNPGEITGSAETIRQLFAAGLLDSAFWHQFVLTRHSRLYGEWRRGLHPGLVPLEDPGGGFALNDLRFKGEEKFDRFTEGLDRLLAAWMAGDSSGPVAAAFPFKTPQPPVPPGLVSALLDRYARDRDQDRASPPGEKRLLFLGSRPRVSGGPGEGSLLWRWRLGDQRLKAGTFLQAEKTAALLEKAALSPGLSAGEFYRALEEALGEAGAKKGWKLLRQAGLCAIGP
jgi:radical SAM superfamily enzyme YgiQ (UPF0313 family)